MLNAQKMILLSLVYVHLRLKKDKIYVHGKTCVAYVSYSYSVCLISDFFTLLRTLA